LVKADVVSRRQLMSMVYARFSQNGGDVGTRVGHGCITG